MGNRSSAGSEAGYSCTTFEIGENGGTVDMREIGETPIDMSETGMGWERSKLRERQRSKIRGGRLPRVSWVHSSIQRE